jgi:hypothetical protein
VVFFSSGYSYFGAREHRNSKHSTISDGQQILGQIKKLNE